MSRWDVRGADRGTFIAPGPIVAAGAAPGAGEGGVGDGGGVAASSRIRTGSGACAGAGAGDAAPLGGATIDCPAPCCDAGSGTGRLGRIEP